MLINLHSLILIKIKNNLVLKHLGDKYMLKLNNIKRHKNCGGFWLKKQLPNNEVLYRCTKCGKWVSEIKIE